MARGGASASNDGPAPGGRHAGGHVAVVDIGSNSVRMVVFEGGARVPIPLFNEKVPCGLGRGMGSSGRLNPEGVRLALETLARFARLTTAMAVGRTHLLATAAVREAEDGGTFTAQVGKLFGQEVEVLGGAEEAGLAAQGVLCGVPEADGLVGDLGGGSLDLVTLDRAKFGDYATLPLGHLRLVEVAGGDIEVAEGVVLDYLGRLPWLGKLKGRDLFIVGGAWRAVGRIFIEHTDHPLQVLDNFTLGRGEALKLLGLISRQSRRSLEKVRGLSRKRVESLPFAALVMKTLVERAQPGRLVFSGYSMREGCFLRDLPEDLRHEDPLVHGCRRLAAQVRRFGAIGEEAFGWLSPVFTGESDGERRERLAVSLLADIGWTEHPDHRARHAFDRALHLPFAGLDHRGRAVMAYALALRYDDAYPIVRGSGTGRLLDDAGEARARKLGAGLRLAMVMAGGAPGVLGQTELAIRDGMLRLKLPGPAAALANELVQRRFQELARAVGLLPSLEARF